MVRQDELPWQGRATVLVDVRSSTNTAESLELVISAAASIVTANAVDVEGPRRVCKPCNGELDCCHREQRGHDERTGDDLH